MKKLVTMPYGSRLYGTFTETSDWDWKVITLPSIEDMLAGAHLKNVFFTTGSQTEKNNSEDTDIEHIPLQIFAKDFLDGQSYALELAFGILQRENNSAIEIHDPLIIPFVEELVANFLTSNVHKMVGYAYNQSQLYSSKGDRLDKLHQFKKFLETAMTMDPPMAPTDQLAIALTLPRGGSFVGIADNMLYLTSKIDPNGRVVNGINVLEKMYPDTISMQEALARVSSTISKYGARANKARDEDGNDWKSLGHAVRIVSFAHQVLDEHYINIPVKPLLRSYLSAVKNGDIARDSLQQYLTDLIDQIPAKQDACKLPSKNAELNTFFNQWLRKYLLQFYKVAT